MEAIRARGGLKLPARASLFYILSSVVARGAGVVGTPIFTRLLSPADYGLYPLYNGWLSVFSAIFTLEITGSTLYRAMQKYPDRRADVSTAAMGLSMLSSLLFSVVFAAFFPKISEITGLGREVGAMLLAGIFVNIPLSVYLAECRFAYRYTGVVAINLISAILTPVTAILLIRLTPIRASARIIALLFVGLLTSFPALLRLLRHSRKLYSAEIWRHLLTESLPLLPHYLSLTLILRIGEITVRAAFGAEAVGKYAVATSVGLGLTVVSSGLSTALTPWMLRKLGRGEEDKISELLLKVSEGLALVALLFLCYAPEVLGVIAPWEYRDALPAVYPIAISLLPMLLSGAIDTAEIFHGRGGAVSRNSVIAAGIGGLVAYLGARIGDFRLVGFTAAAAYLTLAALGVFDLARLGSYPIRIKRSIGVFLLLVLFGTVAFLLRHSLPARFILSLVPVLPLLSVGHGALSVIRER